MIWTLQIREIYKYEIPGGQYSNFAAQVKEMGAGNDFNDIKRLYKEADEVLGNIIKVTPTSKVVGDMAIFMLKNDLTKDNILEKGKDLSYPDSIVQYFKGALGQPEGGISGKITAYCIKRTGTDNGRPGSLLPDVDFEAIGRHLLRKLLHGIDGTAGSHGAESAKLCPLSEGI